MTRPATASGTTTPTSRKASGWAWATARRTKLAAASRAAALLEARLTLRLVVFGYRSSLAEHRIVVWVCGAVTGEQGRATATNHDEVRI
jgi:hypothetical protein